jgi:hypothetical protein
MRSGVNARAHERPVYASHALKRSLRADTSPVLPASRRASPHVAILEEAADEDRPRTDPPTPDLYEY